MSVSCLQQCLPTITHWLPSQQNVIVCTYVCVMCLRYRMWHVYFKEVKHRRLAWLFVYLKHNTLSSFSQSLQRENTHKSWHGSIKLNVFNRRNFFFSLNYAPHLAVSAITILKFMSAFLHLIYINHQLSLSLWGWL